MPTPAPENYKLERKWSLTHFLIGIFGSTAILGVMAKIFAFEAEIFGYMLTWKPVVLVGFMGEALVFILMGMMREMQYVPADESDDASTAEASGPAPAEGENNLGPELQNAEEELTQEAERLAEKIQTVREGLSEELDVLEQFATLRDNLHDAGDSLSTQSEALGNNLEDLQSLHETHASMAHSLEEVQTELAEESKGLGDEIAETRQAMRALREQFARAANRLERFNEPVSSGTPSANGHSTNGQSGAGNPGEPTTASSSAK